MFLQGKVNSARYIAQVVNHALLPFLRQEGDVLFSRTMQVHIWLLRCNVLIMMYNNDPSQQDPHISCQLNMHGTMRGSPGDLSKEPVTREKQQKDWRMSCDVHKAMEGLENELSLHVCHSSFSNPSVALPTSHLILQPFCCFTYVTAHSPTLLLLLLRHRLFAYITW